MCSSDLRSFGKIDVLCSFAAVTDDRDVAELESGQWNDVLQTNLSGVYYFSKHVIPHMKECGYGRIINIGSVNGLVGSKMKPRHGYNASKGGLHGLTIGMAATYMKYGITVNAIAPGLFRTEMTEAVFEDPVSLATYNRLVPAGRAGTEEELNGALLFLSSEEAGYVTGQILAVDGGYTISQLI